MSEDQTKNNKITLHNKISHHFREIHVDGAYGGVTPRGFINVNFYAERFPIPKSTDFRFDVEDGKGKIGEKIEDSNDSKTGILREYEFGIYMDISTAKQLATFLNAKIEELEKIKAINDGNSSANE